MPKITLPTRPTPRLATAVLSGALIAGFAVTPPALAAGSSTVTVSVSVSSTFATCGPVECSDYASEVETFVVGSLDVPDGLTASLETPVVFGANDYDITYETGIEGCEGSYLWTRSAHNGYRQAVVVLSDQNGTEVQRANVGGLWQSGTDNSEGPTCQGDAFSRSAWFADFALATAPAQPQDYDCGGYTLTAEDVQGFLTNWNPTDGDRAAIAADPCVLAEDWDVWIPVDQFNWALTESRQSGDSACGTFEWTGAMDLRWRGSGAAVDGPRVRVTQQNICWDRYRNVLTNGSDGQPALPTVEILDAWRIAPLQVTKAGIGGSGVSTCTTTGSVFGNRIEPAGGWICTLEANISFAGGVPVGFLTTGGPWTRTTPVLDFWRIPGAPGV